MKLVHFSGLERNLNYSKYNNIILSWNLSNIYKISKNQNIFYISKFWQKNKIKIKKDITKIRNNLLSQLRRELNLINKVNYSNEEWEILLEHWLHEYLQNSYFKWLLIEDLIINYKNFKYLEIKVKKELPVFDTLQFFKLSQNNDIFNHLAFQDILKFKNKTKNKIILKNKVFQIQEKNIHRDYLKKKNNFFILLFEKLISKIFENKILINIRTKKINFLKLCFALKILPFKGLDVFDRKKLIEFSNNQKFDRKKRSLIKLYSKKNMNFRNYIFSKIRYDLPRIFIEDFYNIKNLHKNKLSKTKIVVSDTLHEFDPIFKSWLAVRKNSDKKFKIITTDHGGIYGTGNRIYDFNKAISSINFTYQKKVAQNQIKLPCLFLNKEKTSFTNKILVISRDLPKYPKHFLTGPMCEEINSEFLNVQNFLKNIKLRLKKETYIRPSNHIPGWRLNKKYEKIVGANKTIYSNDDYNKLRSKAYIKIITYPQTAFLECVINGPTFLLFDKKIYSDTKINEKFMNILFKNKIAFNNGKDLALHINSIEKDIDIWWKQRKIQKSLNLFIKNTNNYNENPILTWADNLKKILNKI